jgi:hypothetical protein
MRASQDAEMFRLALTLRQELDPARFDTYFFDTSLVYVYVSRSADPLEYATNLVHELGHAILAETPLGFLHQTLFQLAAAAADFLWTRRVLPHLKRALPVEEQRGQRAEELNHLERVGPRDREERTRTKDTANELFGAAEEALRWALSDPATVSICQTLLEIQRRRKLLIHSSRLCHEGVATFLQLGNDNEPLTWYRSFLGSAVAGVTAQAAQAAIREKRAALVGVWRRGFELASSVFATTGSVDAILLAGHAAHHFPLPQGSLFDVKFSEFTSWTTDCRLSADERFRSLCGNWPGEIARRVGQDGGRDLLAAMSSTLSGGNDGGESFTKWHHELLAQSELCRPLRDAQILRPVAPPRPGPDNWFRFLKPPATRRLMPPVVFSDGVIVAPNATIEAVVKEDIVRGQRLLTIERVLERLEIRADGE